MRRASRPHRPRMEGETVEHYARCQQAYTEWKRASEGTWADAEDLQALRERWLDLELMP
jgi:hypothetical protein